MFLVHLDVDAKLELAVLIVINVLANNYCVRTILLGDTILVRKTVEPEHTSVNHFYYESPGHACERQGIIDASATFLDCLDILFNVAHMFIIGGVIESCPHVTEVSTNGLKFTIHDDKRDMKSTPFVKADNVLHSSCKGLCLTIL
jgi:hypothetical protein